MKRLLLTCGLLLAVAFVAVGADTKTTKEAPPGMAYMQMADILSWKSIRGNTLSDDGQWLGYTLAPQEGNSEVILRQTKGDKEHKFPAGEGRGAGGSAVQFSNDSKWAVFSVNPDARGARRGGGTEGPRGPRGQGRTPPGIQRPSATAEGAPPAPRTKTALVELATGKKTEFENFRRTAFAGEKTTWLALHKNPSEAQTAATEKWNGSDLILRELATGNEICFGNVAEFTFDKKEERLAMVIDAQGQAGNGVQLFTLATGTMQVLDSGKASYRSLNWTEKGEALAVLKGVKDEAYEELLHSVIGITFQGGKPVKMVFDPKQEKTFPANMTVSPNRTASWTEDLSGILFGIGEVKKKEARTPPTEEKKPEEKPKTPDPKKDTSDLNDEYQPTRTAQPRGETPPTTGDQDKPDLVLWHWADPRLQSQQQVQANMDKNFFYVGVYWVKDKKFVRLSDELVKNVSIAAKQKWAIGTDNKAFELAGSLDGRRFQDVYVINMQTGERKLMLKKSRWTFSTSPDGTHFLYYDDGHFYTCEMATGKTHNITSGAPVSFVNTEDDHNVLKMPQFPVGWTSDSASVILTDGWDWWKLPAHGGNAVNLTVDGKKEGVRYQRNYTLDRDEKGINLAKPVYVAVYGEWTKKGGVARLEGNKPGAKKLLWDEAGYGSLQKAKDADVYLYTRETFKDYGDCHVADKELAKGKKLTNANPQQEKFAWSSGVMLVNYTNSKGQKLQGALYLPANYDKGKRYPTIVYIYEKLSQGAYRYTAPAARGFNKTVYTSNGYAVFMPDIVYQLNDPGKSAVDCVLPGLEAAIATGVVDRERVGLHGHSWGGYQTAFLITQTDAFKAAVAGAPLTNMVSMYSSIYWNTGSANQAIFESSQGRFTKGYWDDIDAYTRNSPVWFAKNVNTPLLLLHNDRDGAVDWNQGIEYFNTLRRLGKPVVMLQYKGENHGLAKPANLKDYHRRMQEFFDHHLKGDAAPGWWKEGIPHLKMDDHLKERASVK
jgi:dipeptidyl aminopeptidase/acylaminoacyl peptidase